MQCQPLPCNSGDVAASSRPGAGRARDEVAIKGSDDVGRVKDLLEEAVRSGIEGVETDPVASALLVPITGGALTFKLLGWNSSERGDYLLVQDRVLRLVFERLPGAQLAIA